MSDLTVNIPHQLGRDEARRRIVGQMSKVKQQAATFGTIQETWQGDEMEFTAAVMGQSFNGRVRVEDKEVRVNITLPWMLAMLGDTVRQRVEDEGRKLLGGPKPGG